MDILYKPATLGYRGITPVSFPTATENDCDSSNASKGQRTSFTRQARDNARRIDFRVEEMDFQRHTWKRYFTCKFAIGSARVGWVVMGSTRVGQHTFPIGQELCGRWILNWSGWIRISIQIWNVDPRIHCGSRNIGRGIFWPVIELYMQIWSEIVQSCLFTFGK